VLFGSLAFAAACARGTAPPPARAAADDDDLRRLAADLDDPAAAPIWPSVPGDLKALVATRIPASLSPSDRRRLGENLVGAPNVTERCDGLEPQEPFLSFLAGWSVLEEQAWSPRSDQRVAAAAALYDRLRKEPFTSPFREQMKLALKSLRPAFDRHPEKLRDFEKAFCLGPVSELIARGAIALERHFAAEIVRGAPSEMTARVLRDEEARRIDARDFRGGLPFAAAAARLLPRSSDAWLELAKVSYQTDERARGDDALGRALALGAETTSKSVRRATRLQALAHQPPANTFEQSLSRFWALFEMERMSEARALVDRLRRERPNDARAFLGDVWLNYDVRVGAGESFFDLAHTSLLAFDGAHALTGQDRDFYRVHLALAFQEVLRSFMGAMADKRMGSDPAFVAAIDRTRRLSSQLAPHIPDEAAITDLGLDILEAGVPREAGKAGDSRPALAKLFTRAQALYAAHPGAESYRFVIGLAMLTDDRGAASAAITAPLRFDASDDEQLALSRAEAFVSVAMRGKDWNALRSASTLLAAVPRSSAATDHDLDLLRADADLLRAVHGERDLWRSAYSGYTHMSWTVPFLEKDRANNNIVAISDALAPDRDTSATWSDLRAVAQPAWPVLVNAAAVAFRAGHRDEAVIILKSRTPDADEQRPDFVADWLACLEGASPKQPGRPSAGDQPLAVEIVDDRPKSADGSPPFGWQLSSALDAPPGKPTLRFTVGDVSPWLIASPRLCWMSGATGGPRRD
jgi:hypothetical protein